MVYWRKACIGGGQKLNENSVFNGAYDSTFNAHR